MSCNCSMRRLSFHCFAIRTDQNTCHHAQGTESCKHELNQMTFCRVLYTVLSFTHLTVRVGEACYNFFWLLNTVMVILCTLSFIQAHMYYYSPTNCSNWEGNNNMNSAFFRHSTFWRITFLANYKNCLWFYFLYLQSLERYNRIFFKLVYISEKIVEREKGLGV